MLLGIERAVVEDVCVELETVVVSVRAKSREKHRCGLCGRCPREDGGEGRRRWRALDLGTTLVFVEADAPRVLCKHHRVVVAAVPWARHDSRFTVAFEDGPVRGKVGRPRQRAERVLADPGYDHDK
jgi:transposase